MSANIELEVDELTKETFLRVPTLDGGLRYIRLPGGLDLRAFGKKPKRHRVVKQQSQADQPKPTEVADLSAYRDRRRSFKGDAA